MLTANRAFTTQAPFSWIMENQPAKCQNPILLLPTVTVSTATCPAWKEPGVMNLAAMMAITGSPIRMRLSMPLRLRSAASASRSQHH